MKHEAGFFLPDFIVVLALSAIIAVGAGTTTVQILQVTSSSAEHATVARQAQNFGDWVSQDLLMALTVNITDDPATPDTEFIIMHWKDWETAATYDTRYSWVNPDDLQKAVLRKQIVRNQSGVPVSSVSTLVADHIYSVNISLPESNPKTLNVQTVSGKRSADRQYVTSTRPE